MSVEIEMDTRGLDALIRQCPAIADEIALALGYEVEARAKIYAAVDTGFMKSNIDTEGPATVGPGQALVTSAAEYSEHVEYGTSRMAAQPFMTPAVAEVEATQAETAARILNRYV